jgi:hypothetical protein
MKGYETFTGIEEMFPYYRMSAWFTPEDDISWLFTWIEDFKRKGIPHCLAFGTGEDTVKYALWVWGEETVRQDVRSRVSPNSEKHGEIFYKFDWPEED